MLVNPDGSVKAAGGFIMQLMPNAAEETVKALEDNIFLMDQLTTILDEDGAETVIAQVFKGLAWHKTAESDMAYKCYCSRERVLGSAREPFRGRSRVAERGEEGYRGALPVLRRRVQLHPRRDRRAQRAGGGRKSMKISDTLLQQEGLSMAHDGATYCGTRGEYTFLT